MQIIECVQGSPGWISARLGKVTASRISDIMAKTKSGPSASRANYAAQIIAERLTNTPTESFTNDAMRWGIETEPQARAAYEYYSGIVVQEVGFVVHPTISGSGASPDGLAGDGLVEFKCPKTNTHIETLLEGAIPSKYNLQMQWQLACTGRQWCDWVSFDPRMPESMRLFKVRVSRNGGQIADLEGEVRKFLAEIEETVLRLQKAYT